MAHTHFAAVTVQMQEGTPRYTSPHPDRAAPSAARYGAPVYPTAPPAIRTFPKSPLCPSARRGGRASRTNSTVIFCVSMEAPPRFFPVL